MNLRLVCLLLLCLSAPPLLAADPVPPRLMLATDYRVGVAVSDYWISEKLDGVRGHWTGERLIARGGHVVSDPASASSDARRYWRPLEGISGKIRHCPDVISGLGCLAQQ